MKKKMKLINWQHFSDSRHDVTNVADIVKYFLTIIMLFVSEITRVNISCCLVYAMRICDCGIITQNKTWIR